LTAKPRSPFFYVGDKYKLMPQIAELFPARIRRYYEPFVGGGSSALYVGAASPAEDRAREYHLNDIDAYIIKLHKFIGSFADNRRELLDSLYTLIGRYDMTLSFNGVTASDKLKQQYVKTYFAEHNRPGYLSMRRDFNADKSDMLKLYTLLIYGFNHFLRFNSSGDFNLPVGNVDFNKNVHNALVGYLNFIRDNKVAFYCKDYKSFLRKAKFAEGDFVYLDPPYLISASEYNKVWSPEEELAMLRELDELDKRGAKFAISNLVAHKGQKNNLFADWSKKYRTDEISSNYISYHDNSIKNSREVLVRNYGKG
jgi:DNA adenine methylase